MKREPLAVERLIVGQLDTNCYLVYDQATRETAIIDPGDDAEYITDRLRSLEIKPKLILATHGHFDHLLAARALQLAYGIPFLVHKKDAFLLSRQDETALYFLKFRRVDPPPLVDGFLQDREILTLGDAKLKVLETPGHTPGSVCFWGPEEKVIFVGDLLFAGGAVGRTDFKYSSLSALKKSLKKILALTGQTIFYPGHGEPGEIKGEKSYHLKV